MRWAGPVAGSVEGDVVDIRGKVVHRSKDGARSRVPSQLVQAWATGE